MVDPAESKGLPPWRPIGTGLWMGNGETGLARLRYERPDVCVLDLMLPGSTAGS